MAAPQDSRRLSERTPFSGSVKFRKPAGVEGKAVDIASGGIGVEVNKLIADGTSVVLELSDGGAALIGTVRMARTMPGGKVKLGVAFTRDDPALVARAQAIQAKK